MTTIISRAGKLLEESSVLKNYNEATRLRFVVIGNPHIVSDLSAFLNKKGKIWSYSVEGNKRIFLIDEDPEVAKYLKDNYSHFANVRLDYI